MLAKLFQKLVDKFTQPKIITISGSSTTFFRTQIYTIHKDATLEIRTTTHTSNEIISGYAIFETTHPIYSFFLWLVTEREPGIVSVGEELDQLYREFQGYQSSMHSDRIQFP